MTKDVFTLEDYKEFCKKWLPERTDESLDRSIELIKTLPVGKRIYLPELNDGRTIYGFEVQKGECTCVLCPLEKPL